MKTLIILIVTLAFAAAVSAQTTAFTYQGRLTDGANAATGSFDMKFRLFDTAPVNTGTPIGTVLTFSAATGNAVNITGGAFTMLLDFGAAPFTAGANDRYLEISVKRPADGAYTTLSPRQPLTSSPFAIRTISAGAADGLSTNCVSCVTNTQIDSVDGAKITGTINNATITNAASAVNFSAPLSGEVTGAQNATVVASVNGQPAVKISKAATEVDQSTSLSTPETLVRRDDAGNFSAAKVTATTFDGSLVNAGLQYNLGGSRVLSIAGTQNTFAGINNGIANTTGKYNSFFGNSAGISNTSGTFNAFVGMGAGYSNTTGNLNSFFGRASGYLNTTGGNNTILGTRAGFYNATGSDNVFVGVSAGYINKTGSNNTIIGTDATVMTSDLTYATAIGSGALVSTNNTIVLGRSADTVQIPGNFNVNLGQSVTTVFGNGVLTVDSATTAYTLVPGLTQTVNVPANSAVLITTDGGIQSLGALNSYSVVDVAIFIDGAVSGERRIVISNNPLASSVSNWALSGGRQFSAGSHTIEIKVRTGIRGSSTANVGGGSLLNGQLTAAVIKK